MGKKLTTKRVIKTGRMAWTEDSPENVPATIVYLPRHNAFVYVDDVVVYDVDRRTLRRHIWHHDPSCDCKYCRREV